MVRTKSLPCANWGFVVALAALAAVLGVVVARWANHDALAPPPQAALPVPERPRIALWPAPTASPPPAALRAFTPFAPNKPHEPAWYLSPEGRAFPPREVVKLSGVRLLDVAKLYTVADLPAFYAVLDDPAASGDEQGNAAWLIGMIAREGSEAVKNEAADKLWAFAGRPVAQWAEGLGVLDQISAKRTALEAMGRIESPRTESLLRMAMTEEGAKTLAASWLETLPESRYLKKKEALDRFRGHAAFALSLLAFKNPPLRKMLVDEYLRADAEARATGKPETSPNAHYWDELASAMLRLMVLSQIGIEQYYQREGAESLNSMLLQAYETLHTQGLPDWLMLN